MVYKLRAFLVVLLCLPLVSAWPNTGRMYPTTLAYTGPGDIVASAKVWYGLRAYTAAIASGGTTKAINIARASDSHTCDVLLGTNGGLANTTGCGIGGDNGQTASSFCNATTCSITKVYDQSGATNCTTACNLSQATAAEQPALTFNCVGSLPCMTFNNAATQFLTNGGFTLGATLPFTYSSVAERTGNTSAYNAVLWNTGNSGPNATYFANTANAILCYSGTQNNITANDNVIHAVQCLMSAGAGGAYVDGSFSSFSSGASALIATQIVMGEDGTITQGLTGHIFEVGAWAGNFSAGNQVSMNGNQHTYWGF